MHDLITLSYAVVTLESTPEKEYSVLICFFVNFRCHLLLEMPPYLLVKKRGRKYRVSCEATSEGASAEKVIISSVYV